MSFALVTSFCLAFLASNVIATPSGQNVTTGRLATRDCSFPFNYYGYVYHSCTTARSDGFWCAFGSNAEDDMAGTGQWVYCDSQSAKSGSRPCKIPFRYKGFNFYDCTNLDEPFSWCYFEDSKDSGAAWGYC